MIRRRILSSLPLLVGISGCLSIDDQTGEGFQDEGTPLVMVDVEENFTEEIIVEADCRTETYSVSPDERLSIDRKEDAETCSFQLFIGGEEIYEGGASSAQTKYLTITEGGEVIAETGAH